MPDPDHAGSARSAPVSPLTSEMIPVGNGHSLYVESVGRIGGCPAVYLHGGPGSGCQPDHRRLFDPERFHVVLFDQRGAGRSVPQGSREANTTQHLVADLETLRLHFGFERWMVVGGSWGATLALAYAQAHPTRVCAIVLRATFLGTRDELDGAFRVALPRIYPALNDDFVGLLPEGERSSPLDAYWRRILDPDVAVHAPYARAWHDTERALSEIKPSRTRIIANSDTRGALPSSPFMEAHYFTNECFLAPNQLMEDAPRLRNIPGIIIQGRYDLLCPPATAHALAARWGNAEVRTIEGAGHSLYDPGIRGAVAKAISDLTSAN